MVTLKIDEVEIPISEQTIKELQMIVEEMKSKNQKSTIASSPYSKTTFKITLDERGHGLKYSTICRHDDM